MLFCNEKSFSKCLIAPNQNENKRENLEVNIAPTVSNDTLSHEEPISNSEAIENNSITSENNNDKTNIKIESVSYTHLTLPTICSV